jgi:hypothetical protein
VLIREDLGDFLEAPLVGMLHAAQQFQLLADVRKSFV